LRVTYIITMRYGVTAGTMSINKFFLLSIRIRSFRRKRNDKILYSVYAFESTYIDVRHVDTNNINNVFSSKVDLLGGPNRNDHMTSDRLKI